MIYLSFDIKNPFSTKFSSFGYTKCGKTWMPHKFWEFEVYKTNSIIRFILDFTIRQDHAGTRFSTFGIELCLFGWDFEFRVYDNRHWNYENNCWEVYE